MFSLYVKFWLIASQELGCERITAWTCLKPLDIPRTHQLDYCACCLIFSPLFKSTIMPFEAILLQKKNAQRILHTHQKKNYRVNLT